MEEQFILLNHPNDDAQLYVGSIPPPPDEAVYAAKIQAGETTTINQGRCLLMMDEMIQEADRRGLPDHFPVAAMKNGRDCLELKGSLIDLKVFFYDMINVPQSVQWAVDAVAEYRQLKHEQQAKAIANFIKSRF